MYNLSIEATARLKAPASPSSGYGDSETKAANGRILVIDDEESMCQTLASVLSRRGFVVEWRTVAGEALPLLDETDFDVVVTDLHMDGMDGIAVCESVAKSHPGVPVVVITAFGTKESAAAAKSAGAWGFITKPFDLDLLRTTLTNAVLHHRGDSK